MKINCVIIDDSSMQRMAVARLIQNTDSLQLIAEYSNAIEAKSGLKLKRTDLIFLDIEMPVVTGFDLLESLRTPPQVILISGKTEYALRAFDYNVTDYLHKPISSERFEIAVKRALKIHKLKTGAREDDNYIVVRGNQVKHKVFLHKIRWIEALGDYVKLVMDDKNIITLSSMKSFVSELPADHFMRIHKSFIINLGKVDRYSCRTVEIHGTLLPLSRNCKDKLADVLNNVSVPG
ncbi:DNA-binding response regulator [Sinomicrobium pectinilyticum]|uniref:DNA-binding response regulator n=1 Tax=Sinomicrobium pectinilyticum TaxID=1084421 RepID=A0A3N0EPR4_SINP1|nr:LytTR family DNA-binding domain-containing protein [Sinomicrobium pectinilyticum]RNL89906.1 DNA-binding response regulator [Sinomicrobium pectinilyticum]